MKWRWLFVLVPLLLIGGLITWRVSQKQAEAAENQKATAARRNAATSVQTATAKRQDIVKTFEAVGSVESPVSVALAPKVTGRITFLGAREGDRVRPGQVLVRLDPAEVEAQVRQKQATLAQARSMLAQAQITQGANDVSLTTEVQKQNAAVATAQAQNRQAQADYNARIAAAQAAVTDAQGKVSAAQASIAQADAGVTSAQADLNNAKTEQARQDTLLKDGAVAQQVADNARTTAELKAAALGQAQQARAAAVAARDSALAQLKAAQKQVDIARNQARATLASADAGVAQAQATLKAAQASTSKVSGYQENLAALRSAVEAAAADVRATEAQLADTTLVSPLDGVVTAKNLDPGAVAATNQAVLSIQDIRSVWVTVAVPEEVNRYLYQGQEAKVRFDALQGGKARVGKIAQVLPAADPQSRQFTVRVRLDNPQFQIRPGMFARVAFETQREKDALVVPLEAVKNGGSGASTDVSSGGGEGDGGASKKPANSATLTVVTSDNKAEMRTVSTGMSDDKVVQITSGLKDGEKVVVMSSRPVKDGQNVRTGGGKGGKKGGGGEASGLASAQAPPAPNNGGAGGGQTRNAEGAGQTR